MLVSRVACFMSGIWSLGFRVSDVFLGFRVLRFSVLRLLCFGCRKLLAASSADSCSRGFLLRPSFKVMQRGCGFRV